MGHPLILRDVMDEELVGEMVLSHTATLRALFGRRVLR